MTLSNWIEAAVLLCTLLFLGVPFLRATKKVRDLEGAALVEENSCSSELFEGTIVSGE